MHINHTNLINKKNTNCTSFSSNRRVILNDLGKVAYENSSWLCREDIKWEQLPIQLDQKYRHINKITTIIEGGADGSEALTFAMIMDNFLGKAAKKFFPIISKDKDPSIIADAKNNRFRLLQTDLERLKKYLGANVSKYLTYDNNFKYDEEFGHHFCNAKIAPQVKTLIKFEQAEALEDVQNIPPENSVVFCRNFWLYLNKYQQSYYAKKLGEQLNETSTLMIGSMDKAYSYASYFLNKNGFAQTRLDNVYSKGSNIIMTQEELKPKFAYYTK